MPVELRKRKAHQQPSAAPPAKKKTATKVADKVKKAAAPKSEPDAANGKKEEVQEDKKVVEKKPVAKKPAAKKANTSKGPSPGDVVKLDDFGGVVETNDGEKTTLKELVAKSKRGVVLFTYPKASTPGCTNFIALPSPAHPPRALLLTWLDTRYRHSSGQRVPRQLRSH